MLELLRHWVAFKFDRRGVTALEYAMIAGLIGAVIAGAVGGLGTKINTIFTSVTSSI